MIKYYHQMTKITLLLGILLIASCGKSKEEKMLYDYQKAKARSINFNIDDLDFNIKSLDKLNDIKAKDSMAFFQNKLVEYYKTTDKEKEAISFEYVISQLDTLINSYQELILLRAKAGKSYLNYDDKENRNKFIKEKVYVENWKEQYDKYKKNPEVVLSSKYKANYTILNPVMNNAKQTFEKFFFTNSSQTQFIGEENIK
ncbi:hypothetical protein B0A67_22925 [Flavobacterium aquidurense]|jgi:hypothetical protein|uniref:hypothetical protein n=1 Tax=Flavobacterium aquidurense TaxID=362413 RepID=UPI000914136F|nr:hypothetical protein [Flavobacterium aquidurense]OXA66842.1 hypothetical protein B0A67_22925 [Flavobacterium aquidurense]SHH67808.1 hypothetical protein SAMN05444481_12334 [Flavobacterium frigidimaris]